MTKRFHLENRYQDSAWMGLSGEEFNFLQTAIDRAQELSEDSICYGMVRVMEGSRVVVIFPAGGGRSRRGPTPSVDPGPPALAGPSDPPEMALLVFWSPGRVFMTLGGIVIPQTLLAIGIHLLGNPTWIDDGLWALFFQVAWVGVGFLVVGPELERRDPPSDTSDAWAETMGVIDSFYAWPIFLIALIRDRLVLGKRSSRGKAKVTDPEI